MGDGPDAVFLLTPHVSLLSALAVFEVLRAANRLSGRELYALRFASADGTAVRCSNGLTVDVHCGLGEVERPSLLVVAVSYELPEDVQASVVDCVRRVARHGATLCGIDHGVVLLAQAGVADGHQVSVNWEQLSSVAERFPHLQANANLYSLDRRLLTCGGHTAGFDMTLAFLTRRHGRELGLAVARELLCSGIRLPDAPRSEDSPLDPVNRHAVLKRASRMMEANIERPVAIAIVARHAGISRRQLEYLAQRHLGLTPLQHYLQLRLFRSRELLLYTQLPVTEIALACGFTSAATYSRAFRRAFETPPSVYRARFHTSFARPYVRRLG